jgi:hypothetical protein
MPVHKPLSQCVFALVSHECSQYLDMACAAHDFLKHNMPEVNTTLLVDARTSDLLRNQRRDLLDRFTHVIVDTHEEPDAALFERHRVYTRTHT